MSDVFRDSLQYDMHNQHSDNGINQRIIQPNTDLITVSSWEQKYVSLTKVNSIVKAK